MMKPIPKPNLFGGSQVVGKTFSIQNLERIVDEQTSKSMGRETIGAASSWGVKLRTGLIAWEVRRAVSFEMRNYADTSSNKSE